MRRTVLLVDRDIGFLFWLGRVLDRAGFEAYPARSVSDARILIRDYRLKVSLLVLDCSLPGAAELLGDTRHDRKSLKAICLDGEDHRGCIEGIDAICHRPQSSCEEAQDLWLHTVHLVLFPAHVLAI